jgi:hypothetical protein
MKLFMLLRKDLSPIQKVVQAGHVVGEFLKHNKETPWTNGTLVILGVEQKDHLASWKKLLEQHGIVPSVFYEPDLASDTGLSFLLDKENKSHKKLKRCLDKHLSLLTV